MSITFGSLFSGIGGMDLGLERAGMQCKWQVEINEFCRKVLSKHWPNVPKFEDVRDCGGHNLPGVDLMCGGDPCQENSNARRQEQCTQKSLGGEFIRVVDECRPRLVLRENPAVVRADAPWPWWRFRRELERLGYVVLPFRLRACCVGAEHRRDRLFLLATLRDTMRQRLEGPELSGINAITTCQPIRRIRLSESDMLRTRDGASDYVDRIKALGNAVVPQVAEYIGRLIVDADKGVR